MLNSSDQNEEKVLASERRSKDDILALLTSKKMQPYDNQVFCHFLYSLIDTYLLSQPLHEVKKGTPCLEINTTISMLNIICILNQDQFDKIFADKKNINTLL